MADWIHVGLVLIVAFSLILQPRSLFGPGGDPGRYARLSRGYRFCGLLLLYLTLVRCVVKVISGK